MFGKILGVICIVYGASSCYASSLCSASPISELKGIFSGGEQSYYKSKSHVMELMHKAPASVEKTSDIQVQAQLLDFLCLQKLSEWYDAPDHTRDEFFATGILSFAKLGSQVAIETVEQATGRKIATMRLDGNVAFKAIRDRVRPITPQFEDHRKDRVTMQPTSSITSLLDDVVSIIAGNTGVSTLFPQQAEDLEKIDDVKRGQFIPLIQWILKVVKTEIAEPLKAYMLELDKTFIILVNENWGEGIYESCANILGTSLDTYEIPHDVFGGLNVDSILSINPDLISESRYIEFSKLISVINIAKQYSTPDAASELDVLTRTIKQTVDAKFTAIAISLNLADHPQHDINKSIEHYALWVQCAEKLK